MDQRHFLDSFAIPEGLYSIAVGRPDQARYYHQGELPTVDGGSDAYFSPALRRTEGDTKEHVLGTISLWTDIDNAQYPQSTFPPSIVVMSGHGWHWYWLLEEPVYDIEMIERANKTLSRDVPTADKACWNANRFLRVPETMNTKDPPAQCKVHRVLDVRYRITDFDVLEKLDPKTRHKIRTGDRRGYRSRSERDWAAISALLQAGADERLITLIYTHQPIGDKYNDKETPGNYLHRTITEAGARTQQTTPQSSYIEEREDGYYYRGKGGAKRASTFLINPRLLLDASRYGGVDAIMGDVAASGHTWKGVTFSRTAFTSVQRIDRETPIAAWQWLGNDYELRYLLPHLLSRLHEAGMPRVEATPCLGLHRVNGIWYFVADSATLSGDNVWGPYDGPITALPTGKERPMLDVSQECEADSIQFVGEVLPQLNEASCIWPMLGWYSAAALKPWLESKGYRFPILNVTGTKGSGKTTLIQRVLLPLFGQVEVKSYDANTTRFVTLALLGSSNAIPVAFSEFRYASVQGFLRYVLLSYDTGHDPRGRADQTTIDYPLSAPFSLDGEDLVADPAAQERIIPVQLHPATIAEGSVAYESFKVWRRSQAYGGFGRYFLQYILRRLAEGDLDQLLKECSDASFRALPERLPDRVRNNFITCYFGARLFSDATCCPLPGFGIFDKSMRLVYNPDSGRSHTMADSFIEDLVNDIAVNAGQYFIWYQAGEGAQVWFQLSSAHGWWIGRLRHQGKVALEREAIRSQILEAPYSLGIKLIGGYTLFGINLPEAHHYGLDLPQSISRKGRIV